MLTPDRLKSIWSTMLAQDGQQSTDLLATISEAAFNGLLEAHFKDDKKKRHYKQTLTRQFDVDGNPRNFSLTIEAMGAIKVDFPPIEGGSSPISRGDWIELPAARPALLRAPADQDTSTAEEPNVKVSIPSFKLTLTWPKLPPSSGEWAFVVEDIKAYAEAFLALEQRDGKFSIRIEPTKIRFDAIAPKQVKNQSSDAAQFAEADDKFRDLLIIAMNVLATEYAPKFVSSIELPALDIQDQPLFPSTFGLTGDSITIGLGIDRPKLRSDNAEFIGSRMAAFEAALEQDIAAIGGFEGLGMLVEQGASEKLIESKFVASNAALASLMSTKVETIISAPEAASHPTIDNAFGFAVNEYILDAIAADALPDPKSRCEKWEQAGPVKGRVCHWTRINNSDVSIGENGGSLNVGGSVNIDVGGAIEACVKKFWDCSWRWECGRLSLGVKGRPSISLTMNTSSGLAFTAQLGGKLYLDTNLPYPFNKVVEWVTRGIVKFVMALANVLLKRITFKIVPGTIGIPGHDTGIEFIRWEPFFFAPQARGQGFERKTVDPLQLATPTSKNRFAAYSVSIKPVKVSSLD